MKVGWRVWFGRLALTALIAALLSLSAMWVWSYRSSQTLLYRREGVPVALDSGPGYADWRGSVDHTEGILYFECSRAVTPKRFANESVTLSSRWDWRAAPIFATMAQTLQGRAQVDSLVGGWTIGEYGVGVRRFQTYGEGGWDVRIRVPTFAMIVVMLVPTLVIAGLAIRKRRRRSVNACDRCGYDLLGLPVGTSCPECGGGEGPADS